MNWISVQERLPEPQSCVLVHIRDCRSFGWTYNVEIGFMKNNKWREPYLGKVIEDKDIKVTHWMPLPDSPTTITLPTNYTQNKE